MKKFLNNKGYMLVEIILASVLAMVVAYFVIDLTIKLKNRNDDLLVKTLVSTDQAIVYNTIMRDLYTFSDGVDCKYIEDKISIDKANNTFKYGDFTNIISEYASVESYDCKEKNGELTISIPITVRQLSDENFNVNIKTKGTYVDDETPTQKPTGPSNPSTPSTPSEPSTPSTPSPGGSSTTGTVGACGACSVNKDCAVGTCSGTCVNSFGSYRCCVSNGNQCN